MPETTTPSSRNKKTNGKSTTPVAVELAKRAQRAVLAAKASPARAKPAGTKATEKKATEKKAKTKAKSVAPVARRKGGLTDDERTLAALLERRLHQLGLTRAKVEAVATRAGQPADLSFSGIPVDRVDDLKKAIGR